MAAIVSTDLFAAISILFVLGFVSRAFTAEGSDVIYDGLDTGMTEHLLHMWRVMYGLDTENSLPPTVVKQPEEASFRIPLAPHLEPCVAREEKHMEEERRGSDGSLPKWAVLKEGAVPSTPWIQGAENDNLPLTHRAQRDIWVHQFPENCKDPNIRFVYSEWKTIYRHGLGSQLHLMTKILTIAMNHNRILVPFVFDRANHEGCQGEKRGSLDCYFFPLTDPECKKRADKILEEEREKNSFCTRKLGFKQDEWPTPTETENCLRDESVPLVYLGDWQSTLELENEAPQRSDWGQPWLETKPSVEFQGKLEEASENSLQAKWWRSQSIRFMLRRPTSYLCHLTNRARHDTYGHIVALELQQSIKSRQFALEQVKEWSENQYNQLKAEDLVEKSAEKEEKTEEKRLEDSIWREGEPYIMSPILSLHVRLGDKAREMELFPLAACMWTAERLRKRTPNLRNVWLTTEMENVIDESKQFKGWSFFYTRNARQPPNENNIAFEAHLGLREVTEFSFVNLMISSFCDYFVGVLGSNWSRLINELRLTNGRLKAGYLTLNTHGE